MKQNSNQLVLGTARGPPRDFKSSVATHACCSVLLRPVSLSLDSESRRELIQPLKTAVCKKTS